MCVTVSGTIVDATPTKAQSKDGVRHQEDGDAHGWLKFGPRTGKVPERRKVCEADSISSQRCSNTAGEGIKTILS
jgi:hypothetical protein